MLFPIGAFNRQESCDFEIAIFCGILDCSFLHTTYMNIFHKAKHWQIFLFIFGLPFLAYMLMLGSIISSISAATVNGVEPDPAEIMQMMVGIFNFMPILALVVTLVLYGWYWSIGMGLQYKLPAHVKIGSGLFKVALIIPLVSMMALMYVMRDMMTTVAEFSQNPDGGADPAAFLGPFVIIVPLQLVSMFFVFYSFYFIAKVFKTVELQREVSFPDFAAEFFLIWFSFIGVWILQPKINKMTGESSFNE